MDTHKRNSIELCATKHFSMLFNLSIGGRSKKDLNARNRVNRNTFRWWIDRKHSFVYKVDQWVTQFWLNINNYEMEIFLGTFLTFSSLMKMFGDSCWKTASFFEICCYSLLFFSFILAVNTHKERKKLHVWLKISQA